MGAERSVRPCPFCLLQEAIGNPSSRNGHGTLGLIFGVIAEHGSSRVTASRLLFFGPNGDFVGLLSARRMAHRRHPIRFSSEVR